MWCYGLDQAGLRQGQVAGTCECSNELSGSIKCGEFLDQLKTGQLLKKDSAALSKLVGKCRLSKYQKNILVFVLKRQKETQGARIMKLENIVRRGALLNNFRIMDGPVMQHD